MNAEGAPRLFGRGGRDRVLICLAQNGPQHVRALGRLLGIDSHKAFTMVERLEATGVVIKRHRAGGRKYVALDRSFPAYTELSDLLLEMADHHDIPTVERRIARWGLPRERHTWRGGDIDLLFGSPNRTRVLLLIASGGKMDIRMLNQTLGICYASTAYAAEALYRERVLAKTRNRGHLYYRISEKYEFYGALTRLLGALLHLLPEYQALAWARGANGRSS